MSLNSQGLIFRVTYPSLQTCEWWIESVPGCHFLCVTWRYKVTFVDFWAQRNVHIRPYNGRAIIITRNSSHTNALMTIIMTSWKKERKRNIFSSSKKDKANFITKRKIVVNIFQKQLTDLKRNLILKQQIRYFFLPVKTLLKYSEQIINQKYVVNIFLTPNYGEA